MSLVSFTQRPVSTIELSSTIAEAAQRVCQQGVGALVIVDAGSWARHRLCYTTHHQEVCMFVRDRMTPNPVIIGPHAMLSTAQKYMTVGHFRRLPIVTEGTLIGMLTDRDIRRYVGAEERTKVQAAMTETPLTVPPDMTVEEATQLMLRDQFSGLPVVDGGKLVGIITSVDCRSSMPTIM